MSYELKNNEVVPNEDCVYELELTGNFKEIDKKEFYRELFTILPENTITMGYMCTCCGVYIDSNLESVCCFCTDNYRESDMKDYYEEKKNNELYVAFTTVYEIDLAAIYNSFTRGKYIKEIRVKKVKATDDNIECQYPIDSYR